MSAEPIFELFQLFNIKVHTIVIEIIHIVAGVTGPLHGLGSHNKWGAGKSVGNTCRWRLDSFVCTCRFGDKSTVEMILSESSDIVDLPYYKETPLMSATRNNQFDIIRYLVIKAKCNIDGHLTDLPSNDSAIHLASILGKISFTVFFQRTNIVFPFMYED